MKSTCLVFGDCHSPGKPTCKLTEHWSLSNWENKTRTPFSTFSALQKASTVGTPLAPECCVQSQVYGPLRASEEDEEDDEPKVEEWMKALGAYLFEGSFVFSCFFNEFSVMRPRINRRTGAARKHERRDKQYRLIPIANILSQHVITKHYNQTNDSDLESWLWWPTSPNFTG